MFWLTCFPWSLLFSLVGWGCFSSSFRNLNCCSESFFLFHRSAGTFHSGFVFPTSFKIKNWINQIFRGQYELDIYFMFKTYMHELSYCRANYTKQYCPPLLFFEHETVEWFHRKNFYHLLNNIYKSISKLIHTIRNFLLLFLFFFFGNENEHVYLYCIEKF